MSGVRRPSTRVALKVVTAIVVALILVGARVNVEAARELRAAESAAQREDVDQTLRHLRRAARWYAPFNPASDTAYSRLKQIAEGAESEQDHATAVRAWRAIRGASVASESLYTPHAALVQTAEAHIAQLMSAAPPPVDANVEPNVRSRRYLDGLRDHGRPQVPLLLAVWVGLGMLIAGLYAAARRGFDSEDRVIRPTLVRAIGVSGAGLLLLFVGLGFA